MYIFHIILGAWCIFFSFGFLVLACLPYKMPRFYEYEAGTKGDAAPAKSINHPRVFFTVVFLYYVVSCGIERIYQPMATTFGLCGPLNLTPSQAVATDSFYNGGFMCGRLVSAVVASFLAPRNMIVISLTCCLIAAGFLCLVAGTSMHGLYIGTSVLGNQRSSIESIPCTHENVFPPRFVTFQKKTTDKNFAPYRKMYSNKFEMILIVQASLCRGSLVRVSPGWPKRSTLPDGCLLFFSLGAGPEAWSPPPSRASSLPPGTPSTKVGFLYTRDPHPLGIHLYL